MFILFKTTKNWKKANIRTNLKLINRYSEEVWNFLQTSNSRQVKIYIWWFIIYNFISLNSVAKSIVDFQSIHEPYIEYMNTNMNLYLRLFTNYICLFLNLQFCTGSPHICVMFKLSILKSLVFHQECLRLAT